MCRFLNNLVVSFLMLIMSVSHTLAQDSTSLKELTTTYNLLRLDTDYSIIYDNPNAAAKLNAFKIKFYNETEYVGETKEEFFPLNGTVETYDLSAPIVGFNQAKLNIISLHSGEIIDFPTSASSILGLNEAAEITESSVTPPKLINKPPIANNIIVDIEATTETFIQSINGEFSDPDGDVVTVIETSNEQPPLSHRLSSQGLLLLTAPTITGVHRFPFSVSDSQGATATAEVTVTVVFPEAIKSEMAQKVQSLEQLLSQISEKKTQLLNLPTIAQALVDRRKDLLADNQALEKRSTDSDLLKQIIQLTEELKASKDKITIETLLEELEHLESQSIAQQNELQGLEARSLEAGVDITAFKAELTPFDSNIENIKTQESAINIPAVLTSAQIDGWEQAQKLLKDQIESAPSNWIFVALALLALGALFWVFKSQLGKRAPKAAPNDLNLNNVEQKNKDEEPKGLKSFPVYVVNSTEKGFGRTVKTYPQDMNNYNPETGELDIPEPSWRIFPDNPNFQTYKEPLLDADVLKDSKGADLQSSAEQSWKTVYKATGRIGLAQEGIPIGDDDSYGTCVLIGPKHIMTNRHVFDRYWKLIMKETENTGVEFYGEVDSDASEFYEISQVNPTILEERDAVILTLKNAVDVSRRMPVEFSSEDPETYAEDEIMVIGYPQRPFNVADLDDRQREVYGDIEIFGVKRYSVGQIISHITDYDDDYIVETQTSGKYSQEGVQPAITHLVSTLPGNSGSPIVSTRTGHVIGLHFGGGAFEAEPANVGHSGKILAQFVMSVTMDAFTM